MKMTNIILKRNLFNETYYPSLFSYNTRYEVYYGGAGSGKSHFITQKLVIKALNRKRKILVIRKVGTTLKDSVFQLFLDVLNKFQILGSCTINKSNFTIAFPNGSILLFKGLDDSEKIKSITGITDIWVEEATEINMEDFSQLDLRLRAREKDLQYILSFNPVSKANWVYKYFFIKKPENTIVLKTTYKDNKFLPQEYIDTLESMAQTNPIYYKMYALGDFCSLDRLVFNNWREMEFDNKDIKGTLIIGLDFGFVNDETALVAAIINEEEKKIYVFDEFGRTGLTNDEIAGIIKAKGYNKSVIVADSAEQKSIEEIKRLDVTRIKACTKGKDSILFGIQKLQQYEIIVHSKCTGLITELQNYCWIKDKNSGEYINKPIDSFNHYIDALRYSLQAVVDGKLKTMNKSLLGL